MNHVGVALELREVIAAQWLCLEQVGFGGRARHGVDAKRTAVSTPRRDDEHVVREAAANNLRHLVEHVPDVECPCHRLQQAAEAVDTLATQLVTLDDRIVLECEAEQIDHAVHQLLVRGAEGAFVRGREPEGSVHTRPLSNRAHDAGACRFVNGVHLRCGIADEMFRDLDVAGLARDVENERVGAIEPQHMEPLEGNRRPQYAGQTGNHFAKTWRLRDETRNRRQHVHWISLEHLCDRPRTVVNQSDVRTHQYNPTYMPASTPVRAAIVIAALVAVVAGYRWWNSPERQINQLLADVATALSHESAETDLRALTAVASLQTHLATDVSIDMRGNSAPLRGRQEVIATAARVRVSSPMMRVQFFDPEIQFSG